MEIDEIKEEIHRIKCDECSLSKACDYLYESFKGKTICRIAIEELEEF